MDKYNLEDEYDFTIDFDSVEKKNNKIDEQFNKRKDEIAEKLERAFRNRKVNKGGEESQEKELNEMREKNQELRRQVEKKSAELAQKRILYENRKKDQKALAQEVKQTYEAYIMAKKHFKKYLNIYFTTESTVGQFQVIFVQFFTEHKRDDENYSVRLQRDTSDATYTSLRNIVNLSFKEHCGDKILMPENVKAVYVLSTTPELSNLAEFQKKLKETKDTPGALCALREAFIAMKNDK